MLQKNLGIKIVCFVLAFTSPLSAEEPLTLPVTEGSHSVGHDQNTLGINAYKKKNFNQALKHFQVASIVDKKIEGSNNIAAQPQISTPGGGGGGY